MNLQRRNLFVLATGLVLLSAGSTFLQAQGPANARSRSTRPAKVLARSNYESIRARAGESVRAIAARAGVDPEELASLNHIPLTSRLSKGQRLFIPNEDNTQSPGTHQDERLANGKLIRFVDGGTLPVDDAWRRGEDVWYSRRGVTETTSRKVKSIEPLFVARVESTKAAPPPPATRPKEAAEAAAETWIYLVGGARFKVDEVNKTGEGAWYQRGNLMSFLENARIERIERELPGMPQAGRNDEGWTSGNSHLDQLIRTNGSRFGVDPYLVFLVIEQESQFHVRARSPKGAQGLMQLMPGTARRFAVRRPFDPVENIRGGTQYLKELLTMFGGRVDLALASYNAGEGRVISYGNKVPPFEETRNYVRRINQRYKRGSGARRSAGSTPVASGVQPAAAEDRQ